MERNTHKNPSQPTNAEAIPVTAIPYASIMGKIPAMRIDMKNDLSPLKMFILVSSFEEAENERITHLIAAVLSTLLSLKISTAYVPLGLITKSTPTPLKNKHTKFAANPHARLIPHSSSMRGAYWVRRPEKRTDSGTKIPAPMRVTRRRSSGYQIPPREAR
jgi:hypothetical protein